LFCLQRDTEPGWAVRAADQLDRVLIDHAHCEMKAAATAVSLAPRFYRRPAVATALSALAREELSHFEEVVAELDRRGLQLGAPPVDNYVKQLRARAAACKPHRVDALTDRLLVGALIEARSCERFKLLAAELERRGDPVAATYQRLMASEAGHYTLLRQLALAAHGDDDPGGSDDSPQRQEVLDRLHQLAAIEAEVVASLAGEASIHG